MTCDAMQQKLAARVFGEPALAYSITFVAKAIWRDGCAGLATSTGR
jgi:hypothetical protein